jgi:hypothetical protein
LDGGGCKELVLSHRYFKPSPDTDGTSVTGTLLFRKWGVKKFMVYNGFV